MEEWLTDKTRRTTGCSGRPMSRSFICEGLRPPLNCSVGRLARITALCYSQAMTQSLHELHDQLLSDEWQTAVTAADALAELGSAALPVLLPLLASPSAQTRDAVALALRDIGDNAALEPLVAAIRSPATTDHRGTLVYALETHDCRDYFLFLFDLALSDTFEVQDRALTILHAQQFVHNFAELDTAQAHLDSYTGRLD